MNQDGLFLAGIAFTDTQEPQALAFPEAAGLYAVVDGMGGPGGGELATAIILSGLEIFSGKTCDCENLQRGMLEIQRMLRSRSSAFPHMGAALAGLWRDKDSSLVFNIGDCRVYRCRSGILEKITHDHSFVQELVDDGLITEDEARFHPRKNLITSAISVDDADPQIYCKEISIAKGDQFLMCSDGLWECLSLQEMEECLAEAPEQAAKSLADAIWDKQARDNASFIIATFN